MKKLAVVLICTFILSLLFSCKKMELEQSTTPPKEVTNESIIHTTDPTNTAEDTIDQFSTTEATEKTESNSEPMETIRQETETTEEASSETEPSQTEKIPTQNKAPAMEPAETVEYEENKSNMTDLL